MSNQFYNYLSNKLMDYFNSNPPKAGDRFLINFDNKDQVKEFVDVLKEGDISEFVHQYDGYDEFKTFKINFGDIDLVVADSSVTSDFLVTLRNLVSKAEGDWKDKALLIVSEDVKDSINEGMKNLEDEGYPFNLNYIVSSLAEDIDNSQLNKYDRDILEVYLESNVRNNLYKTTLWDFEYVLSIITKGLIAKEDYPELDLFYDSGLTEIALSESRKKRIRENNKMFLENEHMSTSADYEKKLTKQFDKKGIKELKNNGRNSDYETLQISKKNFNDKSKTIKLEEMDINVDLPYWEKADSHTTAGQRKRNIILFNTERLDEVSLTFKFNKKIDRTFLNKHGKSTASVSKDSLKINLPVDHGKPTYKKYTYTHENLNKNKFTFSILVLNVNPELLKNVKTAFKQIDSKGNIVLSPDVDVLEFGEGPSIEEKISKKDQEILVPDGNKVSISLDGAEGDIDSGDITFSILKNWNEVPFKVKNRGNKPSPLKYNILWNNKLGNKTDFVFDGNLLYLDENRYTISKDLKEIFNIEEEIIKNNILNGTITYGGVEAKELALPPRLEAAYNRLFEYYQKKNNIPSLTYINNELKEIYVEIIEAFNEEVEDISEGFILSNNPQKSNLNKIGVFESGSKVYYSPLAPLNIAYQLAISNNYYQHIRYEVSKKLSPNNLLPYIYGENNSILSPTHHEYSREWVVYEDVKDVSIGTTNLYLKKIVEEKLDQFINHFKYLFNSKSKAPLKINVINVENDIEIVKGVFDFIKDRIDGNIIPIEVNVYNKNGNTYFEDLFKITSSEELEELFDIKIKSEAMDTLDVIRIIQENINYYVNKGKNEDDYDYAHVSFYKQSSDSIYSNLDMGEIDTGLYLNGLLSSCSACAFENDYRVGFGVKYANKDDFLVRFAYNLNELAFNNQNNGSNPYRAKNTIVSLSKMDEDALDKIYNNSHWVTFIEPNFDLDFFANHKNLFVIHYSDKYSSSALYDTVTVSNKSEQYKLMINDFLREYIDNYQDDDEVIDKIIKLFNSINGEWLLNLGLREHSEREKLSIVSAIKYALTIFDNDDIIWIPISMEEIIRIAKNVGIAERGGLFTVSNLIGKRKSGYSDDLLLLGFNTANSELYYYPIQIKIGDDDPKVVEDAKKQINTIHMLLMEYLASDNSFIQKFYRNFFIQLFLTNQQRLTNNKVWSNKNFKGLENFKKQLINDEYVISNRLNDKIGVGAVMLFNDRTESQSISLEDDVTVMNLPMYAGYTGIIEPISVVDSRIHGEKAEISPEILLSGCNVAGIENGDYLDYKNVDVVSEDEVEIRSSQRNELRDYREEEKSISNVRTDFIQHQVESEEDAFIELADDLDENEDDNQAVSYVETTENEKEDQPITVAEIIGKDDNNLVTVEQAIEIEKEETSEEVPRGVVPLSEVRAVIGNEVERPDKKVYWEFGNPNLANRHMLVQGKSGQGKTYFMQKMIEELSFQNIPTIIIDYTNSFKKQELDDNFKESMASKLEYRYVIQQKVPLNPFKKYEIELDEDFSLPQENEDVAGRFKSIITDVYNLGDQQANVIYKSIIKGLSEFGEENFDLNALKHILERTDSSTYKTTSSKLAELFDRNPFDVKGTFDWSVLDNNDGKVFVIQLTGLSRELQRVVSEIILWDLWYYKTANGSRDKPFAVILDECQNLDFSDGSPCSSILREGRKFGWSGWFATQSIKGSFNADEISKLENVDEKIYFHPTDSSISDIAKTLAKSSNRGKEQWEDILSSLTRGQCVVNGASLDLLNELNYIAVPVNVGEIEKKSLGDDSKDDENHPSDDENKNVVLNEHNVPDIEIVDKGGKFNLVRSKDGNSTVLGRFSSENTAKLVKNILNEHDWDINYFKDNNIFENNGGHYIFILKKDRIRFLGFAPSREEAENKLDLKLNKNNNSLAKEKKLKSLLPNKDSYVYPYCGNQWEVSKSIKNKNIVFGRFVDRDVAVFVRDRLILNDWDVSFFRRNSSFEVDGEVLSFEVVDDRIRLIGDEEKLAKYAPPEGKWGRYIREYKGTFSIHKTIDGRPKNFGRFSSHDVAVFVRDRLIENDWDVSFFRDNSSFKVEGKVLSFNVNEGKVELIGDKIGVSSSSSVISSKPKKPKAKSKNPRSFVRVGGYYYYVRNFIENKDTIFGRFGSRDVAVFVSGKLILNDWDISSLKRSVFQHENKFWAFDVKDGKVVFVGEFDSRKAAKNVFDDEEQKINHKLSNNKSYVYHYYDNEWQVSKYINGKTIVFGRFVDRDVAVFVRDMLVENDWDVSFFRRNPKLEFNGGILSFKVTKDGIMLEADEEESLDVLTSQSEDIRGIHQHTSSEGMYVYPYCGDEWQVRKSIKGKNTVFGIFDSRDVAVFVRDRLVENGWDVSFFMDNPSLKFDGKILSFEVVNNIIEFNGYKKEITSSNFQKRDKDTHVYFNGEDYSVGKIINDHSVTFGRFSSRDVAVFVSGKLVENDWDVSFFRKNSKFKLGDEILSFKVINGWIKLVSSDDESSDLSSYDDVFEDLGYNNQGIGQYIYPYFGNRWEVSKSTGDETIVFGRFDFLDVAIFVRDMLVENDWDVSFFRKNSKFEVDGKSLSFKVSKKRIELVDSK